MTNLKTVLNQDLVKNLKAKNTVAVSVLRHTIGTIQQQEKSGKTAVEFNDAQVLDVISKQVKQRRETAALYLEKGVLDAAEKETVEADFLSTYLPEAVSDERLTEITEAVIATRESVTAKDFGSIMKDVMAQAKKEGAVDGKTVSAIVRKLVG